MDLVLIGYHWPARPTIVLECLFAARQALLRDGYSVDAIPRHLALEIDALFCDTYPK